MTRAQAEYDARRALERQRQKKRRVRVNTIGDPKGVFAAARASKIEGQPCRLCHLGIHALNRWGGEIEAHHIVPRSKLGKRSPVVHDTANLMPLCHTHHQDHHNTVRRVPREALHANELHFLAAHANESWRNAWYPKETP